MLQRFLSETTTLYHNIMNNSIHFAQDRAKPVLFFVSPLCDNVITTKEDGMRTKAVLENIFRM
jgi:hypothetical protein